MIFNSFEFILIFPLIFLLYYLAASIKPLTRVVPKIGNYLLIFVSYALYIKAVPVCVLILLYVTLVTYISGILIEKYKFNRTTSKKLLCTTLVILTILPLLVFKYYDFFATQFNLLLSPISTWRLSGLNWIIPLGLSFYTFQALGYLFDVYYRKIEAERNFLDYTLFICFFPQIASGPISRAKDLLAQIKNKRPFDQYQATSGLRFLLWGMFMKVVLADRAGMLVDTIFGNYHYYSGFSLAFASVLYSFQIYGDFAGYSFMAIGVGKLLGFDLINNFRQPYLAVSVTDFWHRWHISLSTWLKDYIYIPLGGSRCLRIRNYANILVTFLVSGIWHGANWTFIFWGVIHGLAQVIEKALGIRKSSGKIILRPIRILVTFIFVTFAWVIFRMPELSDGVAIINRILTNCDGMDKFGVITARLHIGLALLIVIVKDLLDEYYQQENKLLSVNCGVVRWAIYLAILSMITLCGVLDSSQFIYVNF